jgi:phosphomannomutase/phosphoglucomutase
MLDLHPNIFREYDIRGLTATELTPDWVRAFGVALARYFRRCGLDTVLIGRDNRFSSEPIRNLLVDSLTKSGLHVVDIGTVITPQFYFARLHLNIDAGVMITASHNPPEFNGFKIARGPATIYGEEIEKLKNIFAAYIKELNQTLDPKAPNSLPPGNVTEKDVTPAYLDMLAAKIKLGPRPLKVAVDCGNGTASLLAEDFLHRLGCHVLPLYCTSDPTFPNHPPDPVKSAHLKDLIALVQKQGADLGIGFDGDGDRIGVVDDRGNILWGDQLMILFWREILPQHPGTTALVEVKCSQALVDEIKRLGGQPEFTRTGHSLIKARMREIDAIFTGEMSGHMFFADEYYGYDDAFYAAGRLLRILSHADRPLSALLADAPHYHSTAETRIPCADTDKFTIVHKLRSHFLPKYTLVDIDGVRVLFPHGWGLVRASNTQPALVARCEGQTPAALTEISTIMKEALQQFPEVGEFQWEY